MKKYLEKYYDKVIIVLTVLAISGFLTAFLLHKEDPETNEQKLARLSYMGKIEHLRGTFKRFKNMDSRELHVRWLLLFDTAYYKSGGNSNFDKYDCISSLWDFYRSMGANVILEDIPSMVRRLEFVSERITKKNEIAPGDIIVFKPIYDRNKNPRWHIGVIEKVKGNIVFYMDMNAKVMTRDFNGISFWDRRIYKIYRMNFAFWVGDLHKRDSL